MDAKAIVEIIAVLLGPVFAVQAQRIVDGRKQKKERQLALFRTLMATRISRHKEARYIEALNLIEVEFYDDSFVLESWRLLQQFFDAQVPVTDAWVTKFDDLLMDLLYQMAKSLGYKRFEKDRLRRAYWPKIVQEIESEGAEIRRGVRALLAGRVSIPIHVTTPPTEPAPSPAHAGSLPPQGDPRSPALPPGPKP